MAVPDRIETARLILRVPHPADAEPIFSAYASDPEATRFLSWPRHRSLDDTRAFMEFSQSEWCRWPVGPMVIEARDSGEIIGSTGLGFDSSDVASTGYVLARSRWGRGLASEALSAMVGLAQTLRLRRLYALCHAEHLASRRVLERGGFLLEGIRRQASTFPNLGREEPQEVCSYARIMVMA